MSRREIKRLSNVFRALSNPNRLQLFLNLLEDSRLDLARGRVHTCFLSGLLRNLSVGAPTISHHVKELESAGLIDTHKEGKQLICTLRPEMMRELSHMFGAGK